MKRTKAILLSLSMVLAATSHGNLTHPETSEEAQAMGYVTLTKSDAASDNSFATAGNWSYAAAPDPASNYFVAANQVLNHVHNTAHTEWNDWTGGRLVLGGTLRTNTGHGNQYGLLIPDLVLLRGSEICTDAYGPFCARNGKITHVTVASSADAPAWLTFNYADPGTPAWRECELSAVFYGDSASWLSILRPHVSYRGSTLNYGYKMFTTNSKSFEDYAGTLCITGDNTIVSLENATGITMPGTLRIDGGELWLYRNPTLYSAPRQSATVGGFEMVGGILRFAGNAATGVPFPMINVTNAFSLAPGSTLCLTADVNRTLRGISPDNPNGRTNAQLFNVPETADADLSQVNLVGVDGNLPYDLILGYDSNGNGTKSVSLLTPTLVMMTNANVETTGYPAGATEYGAFNGGHPGDFSNLEDPVLTPDTAYNYYCTQRFCNFADINLPQATITIAAGGSWKGGNAIKTRKFNFHAQNPSSNVGLGMWSGTSQRYLRPEELGLYGKGTVNFYMNGNLHLHIEAPIVSKTTTLMLHDNKRYTGAIDLCRPSPDFHAKLIIRQNEVATDDTKRFAFRTHLGDARCWGGSYTATADGHDAITLQNYPLVCVTNSVTFDDPSRGMLIDLGAKFDVTGGHFLCLANPVTYRGLLVKSGEGTLELAGSARFGDGAGSTLPVANQNLLQIDAGTLAITTPEAANGLAITLAEGASLLIDPSSETARAGTGAMLTKWDTPLATTAPDGKIAVSIRAESQTAVSFTAPICTVSAEAATVLSADSFRLGDVPGYKCPGVTTSTDAETGNVTFSATFHRRGLTVFWL
ncbi:MAG: hypothetical protein MJ240_03640 [Kiritimatiellae bacterium]|nr:hypothetical protein [Kiritimatiellia bacterium]